MSQNDESTGQGADHTGAGQALSEALGAYAKELIREATIVDEQGNHQMQINLVQLLIDVRTLEVKMQCLFEEAGAEQLIDPAKLMDRMLRKLDLNTRQVKQVVDARPNLAIASAIRGMNGRSRG